MTEIAYSIGDSTALYIGLAVVLVLFAVAFLLMVLANHKHREASRTWYRDEVYAYKVGFIHKKAKEQDIDLVYPPKADIAQVLEEEVSSDLSTP